MSYYSKRAVIGSKLALNTLKGLSHECFVDGRSNISKGIDKVKEDIISLFSISKGEVFFDPVLGSNLSNYIFEPNDFVLRDMIKRDITLGITEHVPEVTVDSVSIKQEVDTVTIFIKYFIVSLGVYDEVNIYRQIRDRMNF